MTLKNYSEPANNRKYIKNIHVLSMDDFDIPIETITIQRGKHLLNGGQPFKNGANFTLSSVDGKSCHLLIFKKNKNKPCIKIDFPENFKIGNTWNMYVKGINWSEYDYAYSIDGDFKPSKGLHFNKNNILLDPYAFKINGRNDWGKSNKNIIKCEIDYKPFDWEEDKPLNIDIKDIILYEMHIRGFTKHFTSKVKNSGTFDGVLEKIPYLKSLGVNAVELMPIFEFDEMQNTWHNPETDEALKNYWGYSTIGFFAPKSGYASNKENTVNELKTLIKELHKEGIEVWLDVVFNHTAEMGNDGPIISFRGIDNRTYYMLDENGEPYNFTGCGNTINCNNPIVQEFILDSLKFWATEYHIDGFRFDLASILTRDSEGNLLKNPPIVESITHNKILSNCKLVAEPWDAGGFYQLGNFSTDNRWAEWNGDFRDTVRKFLKGESGMIYRVSERVNGSKDLYEHSGRNHSSSINFITCHDGFTLIDLFSYNIKHNKANGENDLDGNNENFSFNCGTEGETSKVSIEKLRKKMVKNAFTILMISKGVPMILMGDECLRTQKGNNNAYCQDNEISWLNWKLMEKNKDILIFFRQIIDFRKTTIRQADENIYWHGVKPDCPDFTENSHTLAFHIAINPTKENNFTRFCYIVMNMYDKPIVFNPPVIDNECKWKFFIDTNKDQSTFKEEVFINYLNHVLVGEKSIVILVSN